MCGANRYESKKLPELWSRGTHASRTMDSGNLYFQNYGLEESLPPVLWIRGLHTSRTMDWGNLYLQNYGLGESIHLTLIFFIQEAQLFIVQFVRFRDDGKIHVVPNNCNKHVITSVHLQYICTFVLMQTLIIDNCVSIDKSNIPNMYLIWNCCRILEERDGGQA